MAQQSPIFIKTETFMVWLFAHTAKFPRHERFRLAKRIDDTILDLYDHLIQATKSQQPHTDLRQADIRLIKLRTYLRLAVGLKYTTARQYQYASRQTAEIGNLLGGWLKKA